MLLNEPEELIAPFSQYVWGSYCSLPPCPLSVTGPCFALGALALLRYVFSPLSL